MFNLKNFDVVKYIDFKWLLISLAIGIFLVYIWNPEPTVIFVYPNQENSNKLQVKDLTDNCFKFKPQIELVENLGNEKIVYMSNDNLELSAKISSQVDFQNELKFDAKDIFIFDENGRRI